ncbi:MAG: hypothetical protein KF749_17170 [Bacteroidetes bacterium]|nr:hypothetical protein [Bacteroidota bacterium]
MQVDKERSTLWALIAASSLSQPCPTCIWHKLLILQRREEKRREEKRREEKRREEKRREEKRREYSTASRMM